MTNDAILTKDNLQKRKWQGDPSCVFFVIVWKLSLICFFSVQLSRLSVLSLRNALGLLTFPQIFSNVGNGVNNGSLLVNNITLGVLLPYAGQSGNVEIGLVLRKKTY